MLYAPTVKFDVTENLVKFWIFRKQGLCFAREDGTRFATLTNVKLKMYTLFVSQFLRMSYHIPIVKTFITANKSPFCDPSAYEPVVIFSHNRR